MWVTTGAGIPPPVLPPQPQRHSSAQTTLIATPRCTSSTSKAVRCLLDVSGRLRGISKAFALSIAYLPMAA